jgi:hypothetical protein
MAEAERYTTLNLALMATVTDGGGTQELGADELAAMCNDDAATVSATVAAGETAIVELDLGRIHRTAGRTIRTFSDVPAVVKHKESPGSEWSAALENTATDECGDDTAGAYSVTITNYTVITTLVVPEAGVVTRITGRIYCGSTTGTKIFKVKFLRDAGASRRYIGQGVFETTVTTPDYVDITGLSIPVAAGDLIAVYGYKATGYVNAKYNTGGGVDITKTKEYLAADVGADTLVADWTVGANAITDYRIKLTYLESFPALYAGPDSLRYVQVTLDNSGGAGGATINEVKIYGEVNDASRLRMVDSEGAPITQFAFGDLPQGVLSDWRLVGYVKNEGATSVTGGFACLIPDLAQLSSDDEAGWFALQLATTIAGVGTCAHCANNGLYTCAESRAEFRTVDCRATTGDGADGGCPEYSLNTMSLPTIAAGESVAIYARLLFLEGEAVGPKYWCQPTFGVRN